MAYDEMNAIQTLESNAFGTVSGCIWLFFGERDGWVGTQKTEVLKVLDQTMTNHHQVKVVHAVTDVPHAFCISKQNLFGLI
jgi:hypothetical protein